MAPKASLESWLKSEAEALGFDQCRITPPSLASEVSEHLYQYLHKGHHGCMEWMDDTKHRRSDPRTLWPDVNSIVMLSMNYGPQTNPLHDLERSDIGNISVYARNRDYHDVIKGKLKELASKLVARTGCDLKVFVDTAPVMEKPLAMQAGIGWQGKHTNLVSRSKGSWLFLSAIFTSLHLVADNSEPDCCGSCTQCMTICPTKAIPKPYQIDARRCISYLTIENKAMIPLPFRSLMGNRIYGCDDCLAVCPWNKFAQHASETKLQARSELCEPSLADLVALDDAAFRKFFSGSPVKRIGRNRFLRNVLIAIGNSKNAELLPKVQRLLTDENDLVRASAVWAYSMLASNPQLMEQYQTLSVNEGSALVLDEWRQALGEKIGQAHG